MRSLPIGGNVKRNSGKEGAKKEESHPGQKIFKIRGSKTVPNLGRRIVGAKKKV